MSSQKNARKRSSAWIWIALVVVGGSAFGAWKAGWIGATQQKALMGVTVEKKTLVISVVQRGNLASKDALSVKSGIEGQATILWLIEEGKIVQVGDLLCELDVAELRDRRVAQDISLQNADASYVKAKAQFEIQESQNQSDIETAKRKLLFAQKDQEKYLEGDLAQQLAQAEEKIKLAEGERAKAQNTYTWSVTLKEKGFLTASELDRDDLDFQRADVQLVQAIRAFDLLKKYDDPRMKIELAADVEEADRGLDRARLQAEARLADYESALLTSKSKLDLEKEKLQKLEDQIEKGRIVATQPGMVVYARSEGGGRGGNSDPIQIGTQVRERQEILSIPRTTGIIVEASIHESVLKQVEVGKPCKIIVDALKNQEFDGRVTFVAPLPDKGSWWANPNQRLYRTEIQVLNPHIDMRPGMSCGIEILSEVVPDALVAPLQAIFLDGDQTIAFVVHGEETENRVVKTGRSSQTLVEVTDGLKVGEVVLLAPPVGFSPKASERSPDPTSFPSAEAAGAPAGERGEGRGAGTPDADGGRAQRGGDRGSAGAPSGERRPRPDGAGRGTRGGGTAGGGTAERGTAGGGAVESAPKESGSESAPRESTGGGGR